MRRRVRGDGGGHCICAECYVSIAGAGLPDGWQFDSGTLNDATAPAGCGLCDPCADVLDKLRRNTPP